jgi:hypothetical protein
MANAEHLDRIKQKRGVSAWNTWREEHPEIEIDLRGANLSRAPLSRADLRGADLRGTDLSRANVSNADLRGANLSRTDLNGADLKRADLSQASLCEADLSQTDLSRARLFAANLRGSDLSGANLRNATLTDVCLWETQRQGWSIQGIICEAVYWDKDKKERTTYKPGEFERLYAKDSYYDTKVIKAFISYSQVDSELADAIATDLSALGINYFLDRKAITWGQSIGQSVREGLKNCSHQIIILSPASLKSHWVHFEAGFALGSRKVLLPFLSHPSLEVPGYFADLLYKSSREDIKEYFRGLLQDLQTDQTKHNG